MRAAAVPSTRSALLTRHPLQQQLPAVRLPTTLTARLVHGCSDTLRSVQTAAPRAAQAMRQQWRRGTEAHGVGAAACQVAQGARRHPGRGSAASRLGPPAAPPAAQRLRTQPALCRWRSMGRRSANSWLWRPLGPPSMPPGGATVPCMGILQILQKPSQRLYCLARRPALSHWSLCRNCRCRWLDDPQRSTWDLIGIYYGYSPDYSCPLCTKARQAEPGAAALGAGPAAPGAVLSVRPDPPTSLLRSPRSPTCLLQVYAGQGPKWRLMYALFTHPDWQQLAARYRAVIVVDEDVALSTEAVNRRVGLLTGAGAAAARRRAGVGGAEG